MTSRRATAPLSSVHGEARNRVAGTQDQRETAGRVYEIEIPLMLPPRGSGLRRTAPKRMPKLREPLAANGTYSRWEKADRVKVVREAACVRAKQARIPAAQHIIVQLHYVPADRIDRDPSNLMPTQKAALDGVVDAKVVWDDNHKYVTERVPVIHYDAPGPRRLWLTVQVDRG